MHVRAQNPAPWVPWAVTAALAGVGITGIVLGRRAAAAVPDTANGGGPTMIVAHLAAIPSGGAAGSTEIDDQHMRGGFKGVFTSWFTPEVQQEVVSRMVAYRNQRGITTCSDKTESFNDPVVGFIDRTMWRVEAEAATRQVLQSLWPNGAPWNGEQFYAIQDWQEAEETTSLWRWWVWKRVMQLADEHVCKYIPIN
jgi:hypothetical protein